MVPSYMWSEVSAFFDILLISPSEKEQGNMRKGLNVDTLSGTKTSN